MSVWYLSRRVDVICGVEEVGLEVFPDLDVSEVPFVYVCLDGGDSHIQGRFRWTRAFT